MNDEAILRSRLETLWKADTYHDFNFGSFDVRNTEVQIHCRGFRNSENDLISQVARVQYISRIMTDLRSKTLDTDHHFHLMDECISDCFPMLFSPSHGPAHDPEKLLETLNLLRRLPPMPPTLDLAYPLLRSEEDADLRRYFVANSTSTEFPILNETAWQQLQVVAGFSNTTLRVALLVTFSSPGAYNIGARVRNIVNSLAELMDYPNSMSSSTNKIELLTSNIITSYLWTTWTRCVLLLFWFVLRHQITSGFNDEWNQLLALRGTATLMNPSIRATLYGHANQRVPYMCSWAFELLKSNRSALMLDFRHFHQRYTELHATKPQRCRWGSENMACDGGHPLDCGRFLDKRLVREEQSVHRSNPCSCRRLTWSRKSYISVRGPVAISNKKMKCRNRIKYVQATERTMAISHVWSHGHGGRPGTGMNHCLHERFSRLAQRFDCDSYWIDTLCIPDEHKLRVEAIGFINRIFCTSKAVLVLDRDLMDINMINPTLPVLESTLATFLVCDWNIRGWTMLEAMGGCHNLQLLCNDEYTLSLNDCLRTLHGEGRVDLAVLCLTSQHLMPSSTDSFRRLSSRTSIEIAGSLLSHRHATREEDEIVIWSLISGIHIYYNAESMWRGLIGRYINTAYLMSDTDRLKDVPGFSWAPKSPYIRRRPTGTGRARLGPYLVYEGADSEKAQITPKGLQGDWMMYNFDSADSRLYKDAAVSFTTIGSDRKKHVSTLEGHRIINHCWKCATDLAAIYREVLLVKPAAILRSDAYELSTRRGESHGDVFAVCVSNGSSVWQWIAVEAWPHAVPMPDLHKGEIIIG